MSLKAKLEAVVYAAEEPVTLALLATMFADEVWHALEEAAAAAPQADPLPEQIELAGIEPVSENLPEQQVEPLANTVSGEESPAPAEEAPPAEAPAVDSTEAAEKRSLRQRDRQVRQVLERVLDELIADYASSDRGMEIREIAGGYRMATKPEYHDAVRGFVKSLKPPMKLSLQALETLAVIAYKQPVTAPEVSEIRGVDSGGVLGGLVSRKLITTAGRKQVIGRPILYKTTKEFLLRFGLKDVNDLPSMEEFEKMAGELAESEAEGEVQDAGMPSTELLAQHAEAPLTSTIETPAEEPFQPQEMPAAEAVALSSDEQLAAGPAEDEAVLDEGEGEGESGEEPAMAAPAEETSSAASQAFEAESTEAETTETEQAEMESREPSSSAEEEHEPVKTGAAGEP